MAQPLDADDVFYTIHQTRLVRYNGVGALTFLLWDIIITFDEEVRYIWTQNRQSPTKWIFLFTRYFALLAQARLVSLSLTLILGTFDINTCRMVYTSQVVSGGVLMACIQTILMLRVYALYIRDRRVAYAMVALLVAEVGSMPGAIALTMPTNTGSMCMKPVKMRDIALFGVSALLPQLLVLGLTILKFFSGLRAGWGNIPIVSRLVRDDIIVVAVIVTWVVISASMASVNTIYGYIGYSWLLSLIPSAGCRIIISMQKLAEDHNRTHNGVQATESTPQLTSCLFDMLTPSVATDVIPLASQNSGRLTTTKHSTTTAPRRSVAASNSSIYHASSSTTAITSVSREKTLHSSLTPETLSQVSYTFQHSRIVQSVENI